MRKLVIVLTLACAACATSYDSPAIAAASGKAPGKASGTAVPVTLADIRSLIGAASCSSDNACQVLPVGARPCGGPAAYLAWSSTHTDGAALQALAERYRLEQQQRNDESDMRSDCRAIAPPAAACRAGSCQLTDSLSAQ